MLMLITSTLDARIQSIARKRLKVSATGSPLSSA